MAEVLLGMQRESVKAQYQQSSLHNCDNGRWNTVLVYIKDILRGGWEDNMQ